MIDWVISNVSLARKTVERHGGGWRGLCSVARRSISVIRALGWHGFLQRVTSSRTGSGSYERITVLEFPPPVPLGGVTLRVGVMVHLFYADLLREVAAQLAHMPMSYTLMVSVMDEAARAATIQQLSGLPNLQALHVRVVANRGRDWAPLLVEYRDEVRTFDVVCHVHTKKSLYTGSEQNRWRQYLFESLLGSPERIAWIVGMFQASPRLGLVYPESFESVPLWAHTWLGNAASARELASRLGLEVDTAAYIDFPAGSMFWARSSALLPLLELELSLESFPVENGQTDGTLQHALERLIGVVAAQRQMLLGLLPFSGELALYDEGERNWNDYFRSSLEDKVQYSAIDAHILSVDLFDTLLLRPFLTASGARAYLDHLARKTLAVDGFMALRERAEAMARSRAGHDVDSQAVYRAMAQLPEGKALPLERLRELELNTERRLLRPRAALVEALGRAHKSGTRIVSISDMYFSKNELSDLLPPSAAELLQETYVSCETRWRKDTGEAWKRIPDLENAAPAHWLHIGDNEHADIQQPQARNFLHPVHVLRPSALFDVVPALRSLRPHPQARDRWQDQLWLGLLANRFSDLGDRSPDAFGRAFTLTSPEAAGYLVFGPLVFDYTTWLGRIAVEERADKILFLSREGYLLNRVFAQLKATTPALQTLDNRYFLASRRGTGTPSVRNIEDLTGLLGNTFTGPLVELIRARLGQRVAEAALAGLGHAACQMEVYLPDMRATIIEILRPIANVILRIAEEERFAYLEYWEREVGDASAIVADLGYAGTIQAHLSRLVGRGMGGAYFALKRGAEQISASGGWARARFYDERDGEGSQATSILDNDLLLEAVLTAPDGQLSHFQRTSQGLLPAFLPSRRSTSEHEVIAAIHDGIESFFRDVCDVTGAESADLTFDRKLVQAPLQSLSTGQWRLGAWAQTLNVDDQFTGRGTVAAGVRPNFSP